MSIQYRIRESRSKRRGNHRSGESCFDSWSNFILPGSIRDESRRAGTKVEWWWEATRLALPFRKGKRTFDELIFDVVAIARVVLKNPPILLLVSSEQVAFPFYLVLMFSELFRTKQLPPSTQLTSERSNSGYENWYVSLRTRTNGDHTHSTSYYIHSHKAEPHLRLLIDYPPSSIVMSSTSSTKEE